MSEEHDATSVFVIENVLDFAQELRGSILYQMVDAGEIQKPKRKNFTRNEMNNYITIAQVKNIIRDNLLSINEKNEFVIDTECMEEIYYSICDNIHGTTVARWASDGVIESAFDEEKNKFIFWFADREDVDDEG